MIANQKIVPTTAGERDKPAGVVFEEATGETLRIQGSARFHIGDTAFPQFLLQQLNSFLFELPKHLRRDPYDSTGLRRRRYVTFIFVPGQDILVPVGRGYDELGNPKSKFFQPGAFQPEEGNNIRTLDSLTERQLATPALKELIATDYRIAWASGLLPDCPFYVVGVHFICLQPLGRKLAVVTPNTIHRDGELATFAHLASKRNVHGGWNAITRKENVDRHPSELPDDEILTRFTLEEVGESYVVDDRKVAHFVEGVGLEDIEQWGHRTVVLVDFSPVRRVRSDDLDRMGPMELRDLGQ